MDSHRLGPDGPLQLGGLSLSADVHAIGHSDADALLHAITDALLGAAGLEDIGQLFPDTHADNAGRDSAEMLGLAWQHIRRERGLRLIHLDCVVRLERPKLAPHKEAMRQRIAAILQVPATAIGLKAKTGEGVGDVGERRLIEAHCVALLQGNSGSADSPQSV